ncbi:MAG: DUF4340 domain-containing protein [Melioribacteraceae bacterium]|nr:DUF4340 domain-containing protein [Melioribacteraceae bacterium]
MSNKFSNKTLAIVFGVLLLAVIVIFFSDGSDERSFRTELVDIDTSKVNRILIYPGSEQFSEINLVKDINTWKVTLANGKVASVPDSKIYKLLNTLIDIKPLRLAARGESKWTEFEVDSSGTRVQVFQGDEQVLDLVIGRFAFQQPRTMNSYVRLFNDADVYEVEGYLSAAFNTGPDSYRDNTIIKGDYKNWNNLSFNYQGDSSFVLSKFDDKWFVNDEPADSAETVKYFRSIERLTSSNFIDGLSEEDMIEATHSLTIQTNDTTQIIVKGITTDSLYVVNSSMNKESYFDGSKNNLRDKLFIGKSRFIK